MPELKESIESSYSIGLKALSVIWEGAETEIKLSELIRLFNEANTGKDEFIEVAKQYFNVGQLTVIRLWIDSYMQYGERFPAMLLGKITPAGASKTDANDLKSPDGPTRGRPRKDRNLREQARQQAETKRTDYASIAEMIDGKVSCRLSEMDFEFIYKNIEKEWKQLSKYQRAVAIKEMERFAAQGGDISDASIDEVAKRLKFITAEEVAGYVVIGENTTTLRVYARKNQLDLESVRAIGSIRVELRATLADFADEIKSLCTTAGNQTPDGQIKSAVFKVLRGIIEKSNEAITAMQEGAKYEIDEESAHAKSHSGYIGHELTYIDQSQERLQLLKELKKKKWHAFFEEDGKIFVVDIRAVKQKKEKQE